jgi:hypothetical protein
VYLVAFGQKKLGQIGAILAGDAGTQCFLHAAGLHHWGILSQRGIHRKNGDSLMQDMDFCHELHEFYEWREFFFCSASYQWVEFVAVGMCDAGDVLSRCSGQQDILSLASSYLNHHAATVFLPLAFAYGQRLNAAIGGCPQCP